jgi:hypothetical protein
MKYKCTSAAQRTHNLASVFAHGFGVIEREIGGYADHCFHVVHIWVVLRQDLTDNALDFVAVAGAFSERDVSSERLSAFKNNFSSFVTKISKARDLP